MISGPAAFTAGWQRYCFACCTSQPILIGCITLGPGRMFALTYRVLGLGVGCWMSPLLALLCSAVFEDPRPSSLCACSPVRALVKSWCCIGGGQSPTPEPVLENCQWRLRRLFVDGMGEDVWLATAPKWAAHHHQMISGFSRWPWKNHYPLQQIRFNRL